MNPYLAIFRMRMINSLQYRTSAWAGIVAQFLTGIFKLMILYAFYSAAYDKAPMSYAQTADYVWLGQAFWMMTQLSFQDNDLLKSITSGDVSYDLCRPYSLYPLWFSGLLALKFSSTVIRCVPVVIIAFLLPEPYCLHLPAGASAALFFTASILMAAILSAAFSMFIYILTFVTLSPLGPRLLLGVAGEFLMGMVIPLPLMPEAVQKILNLLPFRYMADLPFRIYGGGISKNEALYGMLIQAAWIVVIILAGHYWLKAVRRKILVQGG